MIALLAYVKFYLLWLNFAYDILFMHFLGHVLEAEAYETKRLSYKESESEAYCKELRKKDMDSIESYLAKAQQADVVSFDIFDTLILRLLGQPTDVFFIVEQKLGIMDFRNIRMQAEWEMRRKQHDCTGNYEVTLAQIWDNLAEELLGYGDEKAASFSAEGQALEIATEVFLCYANPFMLALWQRLQEQGKRIIVVSDMYLPGDALSSLLEKKGFTGFEKLYVSCEYGKSKADGSLYEQVKADYTGKKILHIGIIQRAM